MVGGVDLINTATKERENKHSVEFLFFSFYIIVQACPALIHFFFRSTFRVGLLPPLISQHQQVCLSTLLGNSKAAKSPWKINCHKISLLFIMGIHHNIDSNKHSVKNKWSWKRLRNYKELTLLKLI